jgi:hypothetical protein
LREIAPQELIQSFVAAAERCPIMPFVDRLFVPCHHDLDGFGNARDGDLFLHGHAMNKVRRSLLWRQRKVQICWCEVFCTYNPLTARKTTIKSELPSWVPSYSLQRDGYITGRWSHAPQMILVGELWAIDRDVSALSL